MRNVKRTLNIDLPQGQSTFLWGPRKVGKSTYLKEKFPESIVYDFLKTDLFLDFSRKPSLLREQLLACSAEKLKFPIILDEVQKIPSILDEVHWLIENKGLYFILCGSSARKLRRGQANLLGGRAWRYQLHPFVSQEIEDFSLIRALNQGLIPTHYFQEAHHAQKSLRSYIHDYLQEEVFAEGLTRNVPAFSRFFEAMSYSLGELVNYTNIARDCGVDSKTVKEYYQILVDTLMGTFVCPFKQRQSRSIITKAPKFYLFDVGVAGMLTKRTIVEERGKEFGRAFEHFILMELLAYRSYKDLDFKIEFWRTKTGLEVDFILDQGSVAIEVKGKSRIDKKDFHPIRAFREEFPDGKSFIVCHEAAERVYGKTRVVPWRDFLDQLWQGRII